MCSKRWAKPVRPLRSSRDPTLYWTAMLTVGAEWSSETMTRSPFLSLVSLNAIFGLGGAAAPIPRLAASAAHVSRRIELFMVVDSLMLRRAGASVPNARAFGTYYAGDSSLLQSRVG